MTVLVGLITGCAIKPTINPTIAPTIKEEPRLEEKWFKPEPMPKQPVFKDVRDAKIGDKWGVWFSNEDNKVLAQYLEDMRTSLKLDTLKFQILYEKYYNKEMK
jgi:hypothetical protein